MIRIYEIGQKLKFYLGFLANDEIRGRVLRAIPFWIASFLTGLIAVAYTKLFGYAEDLFLMAMAWKSWSMFILTPICFVFAWLTVHFFAPKAKGSGIPQVLAAIELANPKSRHTVSSLLNIRVAVVKIVSSLFMIAGGGAIGREGPTIQIAGSIFQWVNKWVPLSWPRLSQKSFIMTGAAAGLAAAFNTPLGGVVFAVEELAKVHMSFFRTALFTSIIIAGLTAQGFLGPYLYLGHPDVQNTNYFIYAGVMLVAVVSGLLSAWMCVLILRVRQWKMSLGRRENFLFVVVVGWTVVFAAYFVSGEIMGSGKELMNGLLFDSPKHATWKTVLLRILGPVLCFNTGASGGVFAPALSAGASVGALLSQLFDVHNANANVLILSGMVGFLTGVTRTPFTSAILVLEMTDRHNVIFHLMLAAMIAHIVALAIDKKSLYEQLKEEYLVADNNPASPLPGH